MSDINAVPDAFNQNGLPVARVARVIEYDVPDRAGVEAAGDWLDPADLEEVAEAGCPGREAALADHRRGDLSDRARARSA